MSRMSNSGKPSSALLDRVEACLRVAGVSTRAASRGDGFSDATIRNLRKSPDANMGYKTIASLATALGCSPCWLAGWSARVSEDIDLSALHEAIEAALREAAPHEDAGVIAFLATVSVRTALRASSDMHEFDNLRLDRNQIERSIHEGLASFRRETGIE